MLFTAELLRSNSAWSNSVWPNAIAPSCLELLRTLSCIKLQLNFELRVALSFGPLSALRLLDRAERSPRATHTGVRAAQRAANRGGEPSAAHRRPAERFVW